MTGVAVTGYAQGAYWPAFWKAASYRGDTGDSKGSLTGTRLDPANLTPAIENR